MESRYKPSKWKAESCWDEPASAKSSEAHPSNTETKAISLQIQLLGATGVLFIILAIVVSITFVLTGIKRASNTSTTTTAPTTTVSTATTTISPFACGNMTFYNQTELGGTNIGSARLNFTGCCSFCLSTPGCIGFTLVVSTNACFIKNVVLGSPGTNRYSAKF